VTYRLGGSKRLLLRSGFKRIITSGPFAGQEHVLRRKSIGGGKLVGRYPIFIRWGLSIAGVYSKGPGVAAGVMQETQALLRTNIDRRVRFLLLKS